MQTATGYVKLSPENEQFKRDITPARALIYRKLHFTNSQGNPLNGLVIGGEATEPTPDGGTRLRTNAEEVAFCKRHFTGAVEGVRVFEAVFGKGMIIQLPETFDEIREELGNVFVESRTPTPAGGDSEIGGAWTKELQEEFSALETAFRPSKEQKERLAELREFKANATNLKNK